MKEKDLKSLITVIITVYNRQFNINRQLQYWENSGFNIILVDSSKNSISLPLGLDSSIKYLHFKEGTFYQIIHSVLEALSTPYVIQINDDDFVLKSSLLNGVSFLEKNSDYVSYQGSFMKFNENARQTHYFYCCRGINNFQQYKGNQEKIEERLDLMQRSFVSPNHAIFRTRDLQKAYDLVRNNEKIQSIKYFDWIIGFVCSISGKFHLSKELFHIRSEERLITDLGSSEYPAYLQRDKRLTDLAKDEEALKILSDFANLIEQNEEDRTELIKAKLKLYIKMFHSGGFFYRLMWKISCIPFLIYNQLQIKFSFGEEVKEVLKLVEKSKS